MAGIVQPALIQGGLSFLSGALQAKEASKFEEWERNARLQGLANKQAELQSQRHQFGAQRRREVMAADMAGEKEQGERLVQAAIYNSDVDDVAAQIEHAMNVERVRGEFNARIAATETATSNVYTDAQTTANAPSRVNQPNLAVDIITAGIGIGTQRQMAGLDFFGGNEQKDIEEVPTK